MPVTFTRGLPLLALAAAAVAGAAIGLRASTALRDLLDELGCDPASQAAMARDAAVNRPDRVREFRIHEPPAMYAEPPADLWPNIWAAILAETQEGHTECASDR